MNSFSDMLVFLRRRDNLSQQELALKLGLAKSTISMYERGERKPSFEVLEQLADYFNVNMDTLLGSSPAPSPECEEYAADEIKLIDDYRQLSSQGKEYIRQTMVMAVQTYAGKNHALSDLETAK